MDKKALEALGTMYLRLVTFDPDNAVYWTKQMGIISDALNKSEWQPIETAPKDGSRILCWSNELYIKPYISWWGIDYNAPVYGNSHEEWLSGEGDDWSIGYYYTPVNPTHWMPLPKPPTEE